MVDHRVNDRADATAGERKIEWAASEMPVLKGIAARFSRERPLADIRIAACLHVTAETANLVRTLVAGGAQVRLCASNPLSTQDDIAAALAMRYDVPTFAIRGENEAEYYANIEAVLAQPPQITLDDGADLITVLHTRHAHLLDGVLGGLEETTTGVMRLRAMARQGALRYPVIAVNDAMSKHFFDNRYGTGQSTLDGILRATNILLAGKVFVVAGYGWCGRGIAMRARGLGARVIVTEVDPLPALEAVMDGFEVAPMRRAASVADLIVTATGQCDVVTAEHFAIAKDGCLLANAGHFNVEINVAALATAATSRSSPRPNVEEYRMPDGRRLCLLAEGRLVNLAAAEGHPAAVMDMSFANQALCAELFVAHRQQLAPAVHEVPIEIDRMVAHLKLAAMNVAIDATTPEQLAYVSSWRTGT